MIYTAFLRLFLCSHTLISQTAAFSIFSAPFFLLFLYFSVLYLPVPLFTYFCVSVAVQHLFPAVSLPEMSSATLMALL